MDFTTMTVDVLKWLSHFAGGYGMGIILLTVIVRLLMWPLSVSQQRSMRIMQQLQPKMKMIQERYKNDPQVMQKKMMEFYKDNKFNPMAGCFPLLLQLPIFILLYSALMSPAFIQMAGDSKFLFINRLDSTLRGSAGISYDGQFATSRYDTFSISKNVKVYLDNGDIIDDVKIKSKKALVIQGDLIPSEPIDFKISLDELSLKYSQLEKVAKAEVKIVDKNTREIEDVTFVRKDGILAASVPSIDVKTTFHIDVLILVLLFGASMYFSQKIMMATNKTAVQDPQQAAMQKMMGNMMPIMLTATFVFIPIPAGVLLYLIASNIVQVLQTLIINKQLERDELVKKALKEEEVENSEIKGAKSVKAKEIKNIDE